MIRVFILIGTCAILSCGTTKQANRVLDQEGVNFSADREYSIVVDTVINYSDTFYTAELRIFKIKSSMDAMNMMYKNYGEWSGERKGKYQENISQLIWLNVDLNKDGKKYLVIADGTETMTAYFTSLIIFDSDTKNCFQHDYPERQKLLNLIMGNMRNLYPLHENTQEYENGRINDNKKE